MDATILKTAFETLLARSSAGHFLSRKLHMMLIGSNVLPRDMTFQDHSVMTRYDAILLKLKEITDQDPNMTILSLGSGLCYYPVELPNYKGLWVDVDWPDMVAVREGFGQHRPNSLNVPCDIKKINGFEGHYRIPHGGGSAALHVTPDLVLAEGILMYLPRTTAACLLGKRTLCDVIGSKRQTENINHRWKYDPLREPNHLFLPMYKIVDRMLITEPERDQWLMEVVQNDR